MQDVHVLCAVDASISPTELDGMPADMVERLMLYRDVTDVARYGGTLKL